MGITHYWRRPIELQPEPFRTAISDCQKLLSVSPIDLAGYDGKGSPISKHDRIVFNGRTPLACEPFEIAVIEFDRRGTLEVRSFCKTEGLPYDLIVKAVLIIFHHHLQPHIGVTSDVSDDAWSSARELVRFNFGFGHTFRLSSI